MSITLFFHYFNERIAVSMYHLVNQQILISRDKLLRDKQNQSSMDRKDTKELISAVTFNDEAVKVLKTEEYIRIGHMLRG